MQAAIDAYFAECVENEEPFTITGLALALDMTTEGLRSYGEKEEFAATVKKAKQQVENFLEKRLNAAQPTGAIFNLKNNFGWKDKTEVEHGGSIAFRDMSDEELLEILADK